MIAFFDRCIDLVFYDEIGTQLGKIVCPTSGAKPDITIQGEMLASNTAINTTITITNLERTVSIDNIGWIKATMYYAGARGKITQDSYVNIFHVEYADQSKGPPDRQVVFQCITAASLPDIWAQKITLTYGDGKQKVSIPYTKLLEDFIAAYNNVVDTMSMATFKKNACKLEEKPVYRDEEPDLTVEDVSIIEGTVLDVLSYINMLCLAKEPIAEGESKQQFYYKYRACVISGATNKLLVMLNPTLNPTTAIAKESVVLITRMLGAYRQGVCAHVKTIFDPRITAETLIEISTMNMGGKKSLGQIVAVPQTVQFRPTASIKFTFGTIEGNMMEMVGAVE